MFVVEDLEGHIIMVNGQLEVFQVVICSVRVHGAESHGYVVSPQQQLSIAPVTSVDCPLVAKLIAGKLTL